MFVLLYKRTEDFRPLSEGFPKICSEGQTNVPEHFPMFR